MQLHQQEALLQQARVLQQSEAFAGYRQRRMVVEHQLARLVQLGIRQSRCFGRAKTRFQLYLAATVANLTLVSTKAGLTGESGAGPSAGSAQVAGIAKSDSQYRGCVARANRDPHYLADSLIPGYTQLSGGAAEPWSRFSVAGAGGLCK